MSEQEAPTVPAVERVSPDHMDAYRFAQTRLRVARMEANAAQAAHDGMWRFIADRYRFQDGDGLLEDGEIVRIAAAKQQRKRTKTPPPPSPESSPVDAVRDAAPIEGARAPSEGAENGARRAGTGDERGG